MERHWRSTESGRYVHGDTLWSVRMELRHLAKAKEERRQVEAQLETVNAKIARCIDRIEELFLARDGDADAA